MKILAFAVVLLFGTVGLAPLPAAQIKDDLKKTGQKTEGAVKTGAKDTEKGAKAVGHGVKKGVHATSEAGNKVKNGTQDVAKDTEKGAKATGHGVKRASIATENGVKKGTHKAATVTAKGADKVAEKTVTPKQ